MLRSTQSPDTDTLFDAAPRLGARLAQLQTTPTQTTWSSPSPKNHSKETVSTIQRNIHKQLYDSLTDTSVERSIPSQSTSHTGAHLMQPSSEAYEAEDRCFRISVARRLMLPHPAAPNATDVAQSCPNKSAAGLICNKPVDTQQHHSASDVGTEKVLTAGMQQWLDVSQTSYIHTVAPRYPLHRKCLLSHVLSTVRVSMHNLNGSVTYLEVSIVAPFLLLFVHSPRPWLHSVQLQPLSRRTGPQTRLRTRGKVGPSNDSCRRDGRTSLQGTNGCRPKKRCAPSRPRNGTFRSPARTLEHCPAPREVGGMRSSWWSSHSACHCLRQLPVGDACIFLPQVRRCVAHRVSAHRCVSPCSPCLSRAVLSLCNSNLWLRPN